MRNVLGGAALGVDVKHLNSAPTAALVKNQRKGEAVEEEAVVRLHTKCTDMLGLSTGF